MSKKNRSALNLENLGERVMLNATALALPDPRVPAGAFTSYNSSAYANVPFRYEITDAPGIGLHYSAKRLDGGSAGNLEIDLRTNAVLLYAGNASDTIINNSQGKVVVFGADGNDTYYANTGENVFHGQGGNDVVHGRDGTVYFDGGSGNDLGSGGSRTDYLIGGAGNDRLSGNGGNDRLDGGDGNDRLDGGAGDDVLLGGSGADTLVGGPGSNSFDAGGNTGDLVIDPPTATPPGGGVIVSPTPPSATPPAATPPVATASQIDFNATDNRNPLVYDARNTAGVSVTFVPKITTPVGPRGQMAIRVVLYWSETETLQPGRFRTAADKTIPYRGGPADVIMRFGFGRSNPDIVKMNVRPAGTRYLIAVIDPDNLIAERNESNNRVSIRV